ncbi:MAG: serine/threonine protein kinase [Pirellulaceae bacterium]|nr:serine/threonine protein kinase [Pirellulaceae bacterium]
MSLKSRIGPLALEAPLGKRTASGQVFRAIHVEQRKLLVVRVFPVPLGLTPESRQDFAVQLEQLKQLRHPSIVRCYGGGFDARNAYLVYEMIDGESLDKLLARRHRLPWETAFAYGKQLADALQYAHLLGWVHGRLRPEKLLLPHLLSQSQGSDAAAPTQDLIKLTDFRREAIASAIGGAPPGLDELMYVAPELLAPDAVPSEKSDLYALGAVLYTMLVGQPPLIAGNISELMAHMQRTVPASVQSQVLDCPIWLSAIVDQLLAKDPQQRPFGAAAVCLAFKEAERRGIEGAGVLQHATGGFSPLKLKQADRQEAEKVLGIKPKKVRRSREQPIWESAWALVGALVLSVALAVWLMLPLSRTTLRARAEKLLASEEFDDWDSARDLYLDDLVTRFPDTEDATWARSQIDYVDSVDAERRLERMAKNNRTPEREIERRYLEASRYEKFGDRITALEMYRSMVKLLSDDPADLPVVTLAGRRIKELESRPLDADELQKLLMSKLNEADELFKKGSVQNAREIWESVLHLYADNQELAAPVSTARSRLDGLK